MSTASMKRVGEKREGAGASAVKAVVQILFATGKSFTVDGLREKIRDCFKAEMRAELRAAASLTNDQLVGALLEANGQLVRIGLQIRLINGMVSLVTTTVENTSLADYLSQQTASSANQELSAVALEVLACIAYKQPITQAEIDRVFSADKRGTVARLRELQLVEEFAGRDGRLRFATTERFLERFRLDSLQDLPAAGERNQRGE